jgi:membrane protein YdbS with pleckstrin-like domain
MSWRDTLLGILRVPPTPAPPPGSPPRVFRAAPNFYALRLIRFGLGQLAALVGIFWAIYFVRMAATTNVPRLVIVLLQIGEVFGVAVLIVQFLAGWMLVRLDYELRWYMLSDRALRIREGIATVREKTIALANVQNISIRQGPLQRLLGIADVEVKTAGGGGGQGAEGHKKGGMAEPMHVAYFRGVDNPQEIRDLVAEGVRRQRDAGLGDPGDHHHHHEPAHDDAGEAAAELLHEARALRAACGATRRTSV